MTIKDWSVFGQLAAWLLNIQTTCKEYFASVRIGPEIMGWIQDTHEGKKALKDALTQIVGTYQIQWSSVDLIIPKRPVFIPAAQFCRENPNIQFWCFGDDFGKRFSMVEEETDEMKVRFGVLRNKTDIRDMIPGLGEKRILTLSQLYWMLSQQAGGEKPDGKNRRLLTDGRSNILQAIDNDGKEYAVVARWIGSNGWNVFDIDHVEDYRIYSGIAGDQVITCR